MTGVDIYAIYEHLGLIDTVPNENTPTIKAEDKTMPRPKGSKNKPALTIEEQISQASARLEELKTALDAAQTELKKLESLRDEEQMKELMSAIVSSGKSIPDVINLLRICA